MSGRQFVQTLQRLGIPGADKLDGPSLDYMFENETLLPFLEWFCDNVHPSNVLQPSEVIEFSELQQSGEGVLDGSELEQAIQNLSSLEEEDASEDKLRDDIASLTDELTACQKRKCVLVQQRNRLSLHQTKQSHRLSKLSGLETASKQKYKKCLEQSQADNTQMNSYLEDLSKSVSELTNLYQKSAVGPDQHPDVHQAMFLSKLPLDDYNKMEETFSQELTAFTKKQFFEGIAQMAGQGEGTRYEFLEISNPEVLVVRGEKEQVNVDECKELARLQAIYPRSESDRINALVEERSMAAACQLLEDKIMTIKDGSYVQDISQLSHRLQEAQKSLDAVKRDVTLLGEKEVPALIRDAAGLQVTKILRGDYDLKIARQDYFTSNQDQVINQLVAQRARNEFLTMAYEIEAKNHRDTHRLLTAVTMSLSTNLRALKERLNMMKDQSLSAARLDRGTVDSREKFLMRLHRMLNKEHQDKQQIFVTYSGLADSAGLLNQQLTSLRASLSSSNSTQDDRLCSLESNLKACEKLVYAGSSTTSGQPLLSPQALVDSRTQLHNMMQKLEQTIVDVVKDIGQKKQILQTDSLQATERELFVYFHNDPAKLEKALEKMSARLQALQVT